MTDLVAIASDVDWPDHEAEAAARQRQAQLTKPADALGRLEDLAEWAAGVQGQCPPHDFARARVVVFAGDHGVATGGVSAYPPEVTLQMVRNFLAGGAAVNVLAATVGASVRVIDMSVDGETPSEVAKFKVRRSSGRIDVEDALTEAEVSQAIEAGVAIADEEIDAGADLLIAGDMGIGNTTPASVLVSVITGVEPIKVVGRGTGIDDETWMRKASAIRDARRRGWEHRGDPQRLLATVGGADLAAIAGFVTRAAARRTPVLLDGSVVTASALVAQDAQPRLMRWWRAGHRSTEPAHRLALERLGLEPIVDLGMHLGEGSGALVALPVLRAAIRTLGEMATFGEAGVTSIEAPAQEPVDPT